MGKNSGTTADYGFDFEKAREKVAVYCSSTGMNCRLVGCKGETLYEACGNVGLCRYCSSSQAGFTKSFSCSDVHLYGSYQAERFGGKYVFFCPLGLTHWASPLVRGDALCGALVGGPVLMVEPEEFFVDDIVGHVVTNTTKSQFYRFISRIPMKKPEVVNSLSDLLLIMACSITSEKNGEYEECRTYNSMQAQISESIQMLKSSEESRGAPAVYPYKKERELLRLTSLGDKSASQRVLNEILEYVSFSTGSDFGQVKAKVLELAILLSRAAIEGGADISEIFGLKYQYLSELQRYRTVNELTVWLSKILTRFTDCVFDLAEVKHKDLIYKVNEYLKKNYMKKITLEEVAGAVYLNPSYFSKVFKEEMGLPFVAYVNRMRVNISKRLLADPSVPLTEVSNMVGFEEQSYFTKVFKRVTGMTPGAYRKSRGLSA